MTPMTPQWAGWKSQNSWKDLSWSIFCAWSTLIVFKHRLRLNAMGHMTKNCYFLRFWAKLPPEMTPVTHRWAGWKSENSWKGFSWSISYAQSPLIVFKHRLRLISMSNMTKIAIFCDFGPNYPRKWPRWPPGGQAENVKTLEKVFHDLYLVPEVHW